MRLFSSIFFLATSVVLQAQFLEFGGGVGVSMYTGDLSRSISISNLNPAFQVQHRMNFSNHFSLNWFLSYMRLSGADSNNPLDDFSSIRNASFNRTIFELSATPEYYFLDFKNAKSPVKWSPYVYAGFGMMRLNGVAPGNELYGRFQPILPFGIGIKKLIGRRFAVEWDLGVRATFFDYLDELSDGDVSSKDFSYGNPRDNDFYYFSGVKISYIIYEIPCPFPYIPNRSMIRTKFR